MQVPAGWVREQQTWQNDALLMAKYFRGQQPARLIKAVLGMGARWLTGCNQILQGAFEQGS